MTLKGNNLDEANRIINVLRADLDRVYLVRDVLRWLVLFQFVVIAGLMLSVQMGWL